MKGNFLNVPGSRWSKLLAETDTTGHAAKIKELDAANTAGTIDPADYASQIATEHAYSKMKEKRRAAALRFKAKQEEQYRSALGGGFGPIR